MLKRLDNITNIIFGGIFLLLSLLIVLETLLRKFFNLSLQGIDELSGYALALGACLAFSSALIGRSHMRIDLLYSKYPTWLRSLFNLLSIISLSLFACFLFYVSWQIIQETQEYGSTAPTAWSTPLIWPQGAWFAALALFSLISLLLVGKAILLLFTKDLQQFNQQFGPKGVLEEVAQEMDDFNSRSQNDIKASSLLGEKA
ncbi:TRAP transporter small permease subunit [Agarivorans gilvus]|uniref:TRAP transporter small permease protein n=1 Tax=Agarivorans gilvus TaxID=680279 RepID=A0ABQ1HZI6_9ALTE|nr:TRAP transporter small permease [Agarivorans gilvus]GGA97347.1 TRAP transporter small permease protein [Agarivorans gilvus]